jgi:hypothetical protein
LKNDAGTTLKRPIEKKKRKKPYHKQNVYGTGTHIKEGRSQHASSTIQMSHVALTFKGSN